MGEIEPVDPFEPLETDEVRAAAERANAATVPLARPDWLVGADAGVEAERERTERESAGPVERPTLLRPEAPGPAPSRPEAVQGAAAEPVALRLPPPGEPRAPAKPVPAKPVAWAAAASSLPTLRVVKGGAPEAQAPPDARFAPDLRIAARAPIAPPAAGPGVATDDEVAFPDDAGPAPAPAASAPAAGGARGAMRREAWWLIAVDTLRSDRKVQLLVGLVVLLASLVTFWPRQESATSLASIRRDPHVWDGRIVRVSGRVGEVFPVGGGFAFNLHQGRDTLVVFTRSRTPRTRDRLSVKGSISTGWLDGRPRQALFEDASP